MKAIMTLVLSLLVTACGTSEPRTPRAVVSGVDVCTWCHMPLSNVNRAAQFISEKGVVLLFDEPGCLASWLRQNSDSAGRAYVADENGSGWIRADSAVFVRGLSRTDMGFNVTAFRDSVTAHLRIAGSEAVLLNWQTVLDEVRNGHTH